jgi:16S rRNA pseudouridine516 synthase
MAKERLDKILANSGYGTRKEVKAIVKSGRISINGNTVKDSSIHADPEQDNIIIDGEALEYKKYVYIMMNKPQGVISATEDDYDRTVIDLLDEKSRSFNLAPVGRLDKDTEGLLVLTNDGDLNHDLISPKKHVPKKYYAKIDGEVNEKHVEEFKNGIVLEDGYRCLPAELNILEAGPQSEITVVLYEGKFHQVKRMFQSIGCTVVYLKRIQMGGLMLDDELSTGEYRELTGEELELLQDRKLKL